MSKIESVQPLMTIQCIKLWKGMKFLTCYTESNYVPAALEGNI